jgi:uncharacterized membrane protein
MAEQVNQEPCPSKAAIAGHPIHPMLIPFPIALLALVPITDIAFAAAGDPFWARASQYMLWAGLATGALAALVGMIDFVGIKRAREHRQGWAHVGANVAVMALAAVNAIIRIGDAAAAIVPSGLILSIVTMALLAVGGWYGGELAYRYKIGVVSHRAEAKPEPSPSAAAGG